MSTSSPPPAYFAAGISLAVASGVFIGISFVLKKVGLLKANIKYKEEAGEGYGYLKNAYWWTGMTLMIIGEICNFVAYAFVDAILVTPLGALSVVITTILSAIFLKERLSFVGKAGCFLCIVGSIIIVMNAPRQSSVRTIQDMRGFVIAPGFLSYAGVIIIGCLFVAFWVGPRYGKKSMLVYLTICSLIGGLSVVATQGLGAAVVTQIGGTPQFNQWFLYVLLVFVICTLVTEIIFLNKALNLFNASLVTPTYYVYFTSSTIVTSAILFRGFSGSAIGIATMVMGFMVICTGVVLLQLSKSAKDVPDAQVFSGDINQVRTIAEQEQPESEPKADAVRGTAAIIRSMSKSRRKMEAAEAKQVHEEKLKDQMEVIGENEQVEWDGLRRRKTIRIDPSELSRRKSMHPPLGRARNSTIPYDDEADDGDDENDPGVGRVAKSPSFFRNLRSPRGSAAHANMPISPSFFQRRPTGHDDDQYAAGDKNHLETIPSGNSVEMSHVYGLPESLEKREESYGSSHISPGSQHGKPIAWAQEVEDGGRSKSSLHTPTPHSGTRRQFSFQNIFGRGKEGEAPGPSRPWMGSRHGSSQPSTPNIKLPTETEEERLGLVKGDSKNPSESPSDDDSAAYSGREGPAPGASIRPVNLAPIDATAEHRRSTSNTELRTPGMGRPLPLTPPAYDSDEDGEKDVEKLKALQKPQSKKRRESPPDRGGSPGKSSGGKRDGTPPGRNASPTEKAPGGVSFI